MVSREYDELILDFFSIKSHKVAIIESIMKRYEILYGCMRENIMERGEFFIII